jgi:hypothetical protein
MEPDDKKNGYPTWGSVGGPSAPLVVPAKTVYVWGRGDAVVGVGEAADLHKEPEGRLYSPQLYLVPAQRLPFGPLVVSGFIHLPVFAEEDWASLEYILEVPLPEAERDLIDAACNLLVNTISLKARLATWKQLRKHLDGIMQPARQLWTELTNVALGAPNAGVLSPGQTVGTYIAMAMADPPYGFRPFLENLSQLIIFCESATQSATNGPGTQDQADLRLFLGTLADVVKRLGIPLKLFQHDKYSRLNLNDEVAPESEPPPSVFFKFVRQVLTMAANNGAPGIKKSDLSEADKEAAGVMLKSYAAKDDKALGKQLDRIRAELKRASAD